MVLMQEGRRLPAPRFFLQELEQRNACAMLPELPER